MDVRRLLLRHVEREGRAGVTRATRTGVLPPPRSELDIETVDSAGVRGNGEGVRVRVLYREHAYVLA